MRISDWSSDVCSSDLIDFGVIGVRTGNNENVNQAFDMVGPATAEIETLTAGCNFNNEVEIVKNDVDGLVNNSATDYDSDEFQANIPYSVTAAWPGGPAASGARPRRAQTRTAPPSAEKEVQQT